MFQLNYLLCTIMSLYSVTVYSIYIFDIFPVNFAIKFTIVSDLYFQNCQFYFASVLTSRSRCHIAEIGEPMGKTSVARAMEKCINRVCAPGDR